MRSGSNLRFLKPSSTVHLAKPFRSNKREGKEGILTSFTMNQASRLTFISLALTSLHSWGLARRHLAEIEGDQISFAPPEYVILRKLQFYREGRSTKHLRDIHRMINILGPEWDKQELLILIWEHRVEPEWQAALEGND